jgi:muconolactone D-isomerase
MEWLVEMEILLDPEHPGAEALRAAEAERAGALREAGSIVRIWRIPGRTANVGLWEAPDATALHELISSLPLFAHMDVTVRPLARHYLES